MAFTVARATRRGPVLVSAARAVVDAGSLGGISARGSHMATRAACVRALADIFGVADDGAGDEEEARGEERGRGERTRGRRRRARAEDDGDGGRRRRRERGRTAAAEGGAEAVRGGGGGGGGGLRVPGGPLVDAPLVATELRRGDCDRDDAEDGGSTALVRSAPRAWAARAPHDGGGPAFPLPTWQEYFAPLIWQRHHGPAAVANTDAADITTQLVAHPPPNGPAAMLQ